jgi:glyoxylase-like metal-dependent hydrolase (beta-lactamase superfamily II)
VIRFGIIQQGLIEVTQKEGMKEYRPSSSLLACGSFRIVIDTTHPKVDRREYVKAMMKLGVSPQEVGAVIFTHLHPDHWGHKDIFTNAVFLFHRDERFGELWFKEDRKVLVNGDAVIDLSPRGVHRPQYVVHEPELSNLGNKIYIRHMPGHTPGSVAIFAVINRKVFSWAGDIVLNEDYFDGGEIPHCSWAPDRLFEHLDYIRKHADFIVPGHGSPFRVSGTSHRMKAKDPPVGATREGGEAWAPPGLITGGSWE